MDLRPDPLDRPQGGLLLVLGQASPELCRRAEGLAGSPLLLAASRYPLSISAAAQTAKPWTGPRAG